MGRLQNYEQKNSLIHSMDIFRIFGLKWILKKLHLQQVMIKP